MFNSVCTFPLSSDLFAQAIHPKSPVIALGLASGHVQLQRLLPISSDGASKSNALQANGHGTVETAWRTRRHKGSCRSLAFCPDGETLFSAGTDGLVKAAATETGIVYGKIAVPSAEDGSNDDPILLRLLNQQVLLLATDSSALHVYDLRSNGTFETTRPKLSYQPHDDYVTSLTPLPPSDASTSGQSRQWLSTGGSNVAVTDLRKGVILDGSDVGEEMLSGTMINGRIVVGGERGILRMWEGGVKALETEKEKKIVVERMENLDAVCAVPEAVWPEDTVAVGLSDGTIRFVQVGGKRRSVIGTVRHNEIEGVVDLGFEVGGRMISGGGDTVMIWEQSPREEEEDEEDREEEKEIKSNGIDAEDDDEGEISDDESSEEEKRPKRKKRKRNRGKSKAANQHIMSFKEMD